MEESVVSEATHFHLGKRCSRGTEETERLVTERWDALGRPSFMILPREFVGQRRRAEFNL